MIKIKYFVVILLGSLLIAQDKVVEPPTFLDFQIYSERYLTDKTGNIMMNVNIWGNVNSPGSHLVYDGIDLMTVISLAGGYFPGANLKKIMIV